MRIVLVWCLALFAAAVCAAPVTPPDSARFPAYPDHALHAEAVNYARNLAALVDRIEEAYVRPVSRVDLYEAALVGLYEAAREPVPDALRADVQQAIQHEGIDLRDMVDATTGIRETICRHYAPGRDNIGATFLIAQAGMVVAYQNLYEALPDRVQTHLPPITKGDVTPLLARVRESLGQPEALRGAKALLASLQALPRALDPYCGLTPNHEFQRLDLNDNTLNSGLEFVGAPLVPIGARVIPGVVRGDGNGLPPADAPPPVPAGPLRVARVQPGSPAQRAGIRPGDLIVRIDGEPPESPQFGAMFQGLRPVPIDTAHAEAPRRLSIIRPGRPEPILASVNLADYKAESVFGARRKSDGSWDFMLDPIQRIGYIRLGGIRSRVGRIRLPDGEFFPYGSDKEFGDALRSLRASDIRGLVFDLRWCPGGTLDEAIAIARQFLPQQLPTTMPVYWQLDRSGTQTPKSTDSADDPFTDVPIVVLVNGETSGGGELIAAALQDHRRAVIAGQRTVGKASIQNQPPGELREVGFKLTMLTFLRPNGKNLQRFPDSRPSDDWGVRPDVGRALPLTAEAGRRLKEWWTLQTLRPPDTTEALPLDDPQNDPQRLAAMQMLREMMKK